MIKDTAKRAEALTVGVKQHTAVMSCIMANERKLAKYAAGVNTLSTLPGCKHAAVSRFCDCSETSTMPNELFLGLAANSRLIIEVLPATRLFTRLHSTFQHLSCYLPSIQAAALLFVSRDTPSDRFGRMSRVQQNSQPAVKPSLRSSPPLESSTVIPLMCTLSLLSKLPRR